MHHLGLRAARAAMLALAAVATGLSAADAAPARLTVMSGDHAAARAWVANGQKLFETAFQPLVVGTSPPDLKVRFRCITPGCIMPPQVQETGTRVDKSAFDIDGANGKAAITLILWTPSTGPITIIATPAGKTSPRITFTLNAN